MKVVHLLPNMKSSPSSNKYYQIDGYPGSCKFYLVEALNIEAQYMRKNNTK